MERYEVIIPAELLLSSEIEAVRYGAITHSRIRLEGVVATPGAVIEMCAIRSSIRLDGAHRYFNQYWVFNTPVIIDHERNHIADCRIHIVSEVTGDTYEVR